MLEFRDVKHTIQSSARQHLVDKMRRIHQLKLNIAVPSPLLQRKQDSQAAGIQGFHVGQINHHNANVFLRENRIPKRAYSGAANDPPDASHNRYIARFFHIDGKHDWLPHSLNIYANRRPEVPDVTTQKVKSCNVSLPKLSRHESIGQGNLLLAMAFARPKKTESENELYEYAVGALGRRMRSVAELKRLLRPRVEAETEYGQTLIELVIRRLKDHGYLNDAQYAAAYSSFRRDNEKFGRRRVITDLKAKGVHGEVIEKAVGAVYDEVSDEKQAREYLKRKRLVKPKDQKQAARIFRQLTRAGFASKTIFTVLKKWEVDEETLSAFEGELE